MLTLQEPHGHAAARPCHTSFGPQVNTALIDENGGKNRFEATVEYQAPTKRYYIPVGMEDNPVFDNADNIIKSFTRLLRWRRVGGQDVEVASHTYPRPKPPSILLEP